MSINSSKSTPALSSLNNNVNATSLTTNNDINVQINAFIDKLKRRQIQGSYEISLETLQLLKRFIGFIKFSSIDELFTKLSQLGYQLEKAQPREFSCGNMIRRLLYIIKEELLSDQQQQQQQEQQQQQQQQGSSTHNAASITTSAEPMISSMFNLLQTPENNDNSKFKISLKTLKAKNTDVRQLMIQGIKDLIDEISNIDDGIFSIAIDLIHDREILLTPTPDSKTVLKFLLKAKKQGGRNFTVLVTEGYPTNTKRAHEFAWKLSSNGIDTVVIPDSMVFSVMSRVGKVILGCKQIFSNGACIASTTGVTSCCECAKEFKTPVFAVAGLYKLSPLYPFNISDFIEIGSGGHISLDRLMTVNPLDDYVPPENIDIVITNIGGFAPSFMYRIVWDNYKQEDVVFAPVTGNLY
ncbi:related to Translation initiation factor eIF-2B subunit beta [Saccharomycodes ludwigii]|uniref:Translation initiation factor eIF2B subunit beta n=1 Tax=Saccharomycodes ludwigii TaxID=36035 RepID=A0A376B9B6_9ASCO|nr:hypothetical protein SCDLUD_000877 [Saccharomycodes ludwigii]KAH3903256.1 hypothetical protein SCDLUD_000877 [Saccharomycodes ludwigii]SSD61266.1 related to Translation initiation factor eIF-2B subunit beta [Saccharomycodes ludwigii]